MIMANAPANPSTGSYDSTQTYGLVSSAGISDSRQRQCPSAPSRCFDPALATVKKNLVPAPAAACLRGDGMIIGMYLFGLLPAKV